MPFVMCISFSCLQLPFRPGRGLFAAAVAAALWALTPYQGLPQPYRNWTVKPTTQGEVLALIIANQDYDHSTDLVQPLPSAKVLEAALKKQGATVMVGYNLDLTQMKTLLTSFSERMGSHKAALVCYLGHGFQIEGHNYLIPVDANPHTTAQVKLQTLDLDVLQELINNPRLPKCVIVDACRDNPEFVASFEAGQRSALTARGMTSAAAGINTKIYFTVQKGQPVRDDNPFLRYFSEGVSRGGCLEEVVRGVYQQVLDATQNGQVPAEYGMMLGNISFGKASPTPPLPPPPVPRPDRDGDGIPDAEDKCPEVGGVPARNGCPDLPSFYTETANGVSFVMRAVPGGSFMMGCTSEQRDCDEDEQPAHKVQLGEFYLAETEVTQALWQAVMGTNPSHFAGCDQCPVEQVGWGEAQAFVRKLNGMTGKRYRLPTEAEWEYAAREGGKAVLFGNGQQEAAAEAMNFDAQNHRSAYSFPGVNAGKPLPVKSFPPNALGLHDMAGNVWELCADWHSPLYYATGPADAPAGPAEGTSRVMRGGAWGLHPRHCRTANRNTLLPSEKSRSVGLRLAAPLGR